MILFAVVFSLYTRITDNRQQVNRKVCLKVEGIPFEFCRQA